LFWVPIKISIRGTAGKLTGFNEMSAFWIVLTRSWIPGVGKLKKRYASPPSVVVSDWRLWNFHYLIGINSVWSIALKV
jgi:hypothetical protein